jgi:hypothetical protein
VALERLAQVAGVGRERLVDLLAERLRNLARAIAERLLDLAGNLLELVAHELRVGAGRLAVEHARPDLDGVGNRANGVLARFLAVAHEADGAVVGDDEAVDDEPIADYADICLAEWCCGFHKDFSA